MEKSKGPSGCSLIGLIYGVIFIVVASLAFLVAIPSFKQAQITSCDMLQSGIQQFSPNSRPEVKPMTAELCKQVVEDSWFVRAFIGVVGSIVISAFVTAVSIALLFFMTSNSNPSTAGSDDSSK